MATGRQLVVLILVVSLISFSSGGLLPSSACNFFVRTFQFIGCANGETNFCRLYYSFYTQPFFGLRLCNNFACQFYDAPASSECALTCTASQLVSLGICRVGRTCCTSTVTDMI